MTDEISEIVLQEFGTLNSIVFAISVASGAFVGIYFGYFAKKGNNEEADYLVGGRNMKVIPVAMSLVASNLSGVTLLGLPADVFVYGSQVMYFNAFHGLISYVYNTHILPVFHGLQGLSVNEYFVLRFDKRVRILASTIYVLTTITLLPVIIYAPALAYGQVSGYNVHYITPFISLVCIFYTCIGGIKAVIWTDVIQMMFMIMCMALVAVKGTYDIGGLSTVWARNVATERIEQPLIDFDPTVRHTIFGIVIGNGLTQLYYGYLNPGMVQRHQTLRTVKQAKQTVWVYTVLITLTLLLCGYTGLVMAANYFDCDPASIGLIQKKDQIVPLFVMQSLGGIPGLVGFFIAGIFSAALSTMSTSLNTLSAVFLEDWIRGCNLWNPTEHQATWTMKIVVVVIGIWTVAVVFVVEKMGMLIQMSMSVISIASGPMLILFFSGLFLPWVSTAGVLVGAITAMVSVTPLSLITQVYLSEGLLRFPAKTISVDGCSQIYNVSQEWISSINFPEETLWPMGPTRGDVQYLFRLSYLWYIPISVTCGLAATVLFTVFVSRTNLKDVDRRLIAPIARRWLPGTADEDRGEHVIITDLEMSQIKTVTSPS